jgi:peptidoglycan/LPS O-acetylase OafA/YrhL
MNFRYDINGLRAIAVIAVVLFHFNPSWVPGGFAGVDVFFVISGFLMTGIIFRGLENDSFNLFKFYVARANRILPALSVLIIFCFICGYFLLSPLSYEVLNKHAISSLGFISNFIYWKESGYFDPSSSSKWLLHTWSLSVEWQFYILYPIALVILRKVMPLKWIPLLLLVATFFILIASVFISLRWPNPSYYLLPIRSWELLLGGCVNLYANRINVKGKFLEIVGLSLVIFSYFFLPSDAVWPGYLAAIPVLGSCFILLANRNDSIITGNIIFQKLGSWSYSIYLWHWPVFVIMNLLGVLYKFEFLGVLVSVALGWLSFNFIERKKSTRETITLVVFSMFAMLLVYFTNGAEFRVDERFRYSELEMVNFEYGGKGFESNEIYHIGSKSNDFIMFGDSYGQQYSYGLKASKFGITSFFDHGCFVSPNLTRYFSGIEDSACSNAFSVVKDVASKNLNSSIIIASAWNYKNNHGFKGRGSFESLSDEDWYEILFDELDSIIDELGKGRDYYLVGRPQGDPLRTFDCLMKQGMTFSKQCENSVVIKEDTINKKLFEYAKQYDNVIYFDVNSKLCDQERCTVSDGKFPIYNDGSHISTFGSSYTLDVFERVLN